MPQSCGDREKMLTENERQLYNFNLPHIACSKNTVGWVLYIIL